METSVGGHLAKHYWLCEDHWQWVYEASNRKFERTGYLDLAPSAAIATAVDGIVRSLGGHGTYSAAHVRQGDRLTVEMGNLRVQLVTPQRLYSAITYMAAQNTRTVVFVSTDRPEVLRDGPWALRLHTEFRVMTIHDMWKHVGCGCLAQHQLHLHRLSHHALRAL